MVVARDLVGCLVVLFFCLLFWEGVAGSYVLLLTGLGSDKGKR